MKTLLSLIFVLASVSAFAQYRQDYEQGQYQQQAPTQHYPQGQYQEQYPQQQQTHYSPAPSSSYQYEQYRTDYRGQNRQSYEQYRPAPWHQSQSSCPRQCPTTSSTNCSVIMVDACDRQIYRYYGHLDRRSGYCSVMTLCNQQIRSEGQYGARCLQVRGR